MRDQDDWFPPETIMMIGKISLIGGDKSQSLLAEVRSELMNSRVTEEINHHLKIYRGSREREK